MVCDEEGADEEEDAHEEGVGDVVAAHGLHAKHGHAVVSGELSRGKKDVNK